MCTVSFIPVGDTIFITSNRDESSNRPKALPPAQYIINNHQLIFPKDAHAGGTWVCANNNGNIAVLLNGAFTGHKVKPPYKKSRGLVFLDVVASNDMVNTFNKVDLNNIEPFTLVLWNNGNLFECRWDGFNKHIKPCNAAIGHIWSSSTLYSKEIIEKREQWFVNWLKQNSNPNAISVFNLHRFGGEGDRQNDYFMNRNNAMLTVSITSIISNAENITMRYYDMPGDTITQHNFIVEKAGVMR
jgi:Transport and Golgi organisation 2